MKIIDPIFTDVLGWPKEQVHLESQATASGRILAPTKYIPLKPSASPDGRMGRYK
jgi:hypothetical protein